MVSPEFDTQYIYSEDETAKLLWCSVRTLQHWRVVGGGPLFVKAGRRVLYRHQDIADFLDQRLRRTTTDACASGARS